MSAEKLPELSGYVYWLLPDAASYKLFEGVVRQLSTKYGTPSFPPHITLISPPGHFSESALINLASGISALSSPFTVHTETVASKNHPYQRLAVSLKHSERLIQLFGQSASLLGKSPESLPWFHLSLLYSQRNDLFPDADLPVSLHDLPSSFRADRLALIRLSGGPQNWDIVHTLSFTN